LLIAADAADAAAGVAEQLSAAMTQCVTLTASSPHRTTIRSAALCSRRHNVKY